MALWRHAASLPPQLRAMRPLAAVLVLQVVLAVVFITLVATDNVPFVDDSSDAAAPPPKTPKVDRFDSRAAFKLLREQVELGPRPAGSQTSRRLARRLRSQLPNGRFERIPGHPRLAQRGRVRARARSLARGDRRRALRHQGHPGLRGSERRRGGHGSRGPAGAHDQAAPAAADGHVHALRRRGEPGRGFRCPVLRQGPAGQQGRRAPARRRRGHDPARLRGGRGSARPARGELRPRASGAGCAALRAPLAPPAASRTRQAARSWTTTSPSCAAASPRSTSSTSTSPAGTRPATTCRRWPSAAST